MKFVRIALVASIVACVASAGRAQYGLYGAPETLRVPQQSSVSSYDAASYAAPSPPPPTSSPATYAAPAGYPNTNYPAAGVPTVQPGPRGGYYQQPYQTYSPQAAAQYRGAPQPQATAMYQPYPTSQYRNANAYGRPTTQMMASQSGATPSMPAPPTAPAALPPTAVADYNYAPTPVPTPAPTPVPTPAPQPQGLMGQMLSEQNQYGSGADGCSPCRSGCNAGCEGCGLDCCEQGCGSRWYAGLSALVLGRSDAPRVWTTYRDGHNETELMNTQFGTKWSWGGEARLGYRFCSDCVPYAIEATYWTTEPMTGSRSCMWPGGYVSTPLVVRYIDFNGESAQNWFDGAEEHRLSRRDELHNFEINLLREQLAWACDSPWDIGWSVGVRYFRFQEDLDFETRRQGAQWTDLPGVAYLDDTVTNNLIGVQFGFDAAYCVGSGVRLFVRPEVGMYDNIMDSDFRCATGNNIPGHTADFGSFPAKGHKNGIAFLTEIDLGVDWQITRCWSARAGYRVVAITGVALADSQFPPYVNDITDSIEDVRHTDSLVLHGAFFGITYSF
ncbi:MAG: BBP7 family outer membrane beta-barrel protein [Thermoguttaceae bacterium]